MWGDIIATAPTQLFQTGEVPGDQETPDYALCTLQQRGR
jgi:hypothetical protein